MKRYPFSTFEHLRLYIVLFAIPVVMSGGCKRVTSADVCGIYRRSGNGVVDTIILSKTGDFQQTISYTNGGIWTNNGSWKFSVQVVEFDKLYEAFEIDPDPNKIGAVVVFPPRLATTEVLWVEKGRLVKNSVQPFWFKQRSDTRMEPYEPTKARAVPRIVK
jgi:hypothetical protein